MAWSTPYRDAATIYGKKPERLSTTCSVPNNLKLPIGALSATVRPRAALNGISPPAGKQVKRVTAALAGKWRRYGHFGSLYWLFAAPDRPHCDRVTSRRLARLRQTV